jgi:hypothetical protein
MRVAIFTDNDFGVYRTREPRAKSVVPEVHNLHDRHAVVLEASPAGGIQ